MSAIPPAGETVLNVEVPLPRRPECVALARQLVQERADGYVTGTTLADLKLIATELVANAYIHGRGAIRLRLGSSGERVRIEVIDEGHDQAIKIRAQPAEASGGYGLVLVDELSLNWGAFEGTTHVWADLPAGRSRAPEDRPPV